MDKEIINYMVSVVRTMDDKDILDFMKEYIDELSEGEISSLISEIHDDEVLSNYVKYVSDNIDIILCKWNDSSIYYQDFRDNCFNYDDIYNGDDFLASDEDNDKMLIVNEFIDDLMNIIDKIESDYERVNLLNLLFKKIKPAIIYYIGQDIFDSDFKNFFEANLLMILNKMCDLDILKLLNDNEKLLDKNETLLLFNTIESDELKYSVIDRYDFIDDFVNYHYVNDKDLILNYVQIISNIYSNKETINYDYVSVIVSDIIDVCYNIDDDDFLEDIFKKLFEICDILFLPIVAAIRDDDRKIELFNYYNMSSVDGYVDVLSSIRDNNKFRELYDDLNDGFIDGFEGFNDSDRIKLICSRKDNSLAYELLSVKYNEFRRNSSSGSSRVIDMSLLNQICSLIGIFDEKEQVNIYNWFSENVLLEEKVLLILPLKNNDVKRELLYDMKVLDDKNTSNYVMSRKLYN